MDSDDDMPPPLDDMTEKLEQKNMFKKAAQTG